MRHSTDNCQWKTFYRVRAIRRSGLEAALKCRSHKKGRYAPPAHMIKLTQEREITSYVWVHPDENR